MVNKHTYIYIYMYIERLLLKAAKLLLLLTFKILKKENADLRIERYNRRHLVCLYARRRVDASACNQSVTGIIVLLNTAF